MFVLQAGILAFFDHSGNEVDKPTKYSVATKKRSPTG